MYDYKLGKCRYKTYTYMYRGDTQHYGVFFT